MPKKHKVTITKDENDNCCHYKDQTSGDRNTKAHRCEIIEWHNKTNMEITLNWQGKNPMDTDPIVIPARRKVSAVVKGRALNGEHYYNGRECPDCNAPGPKVDVPPPDGGG